MAQCSLSLPSTTGAGAGATWRATLARRGEASHGAGAVGGAAVYCAGAAWGAALVRPRRSFLSLHGKQHGGASLLHNAGPGGARLPPRRAARQREAPPRRAASRRCEAPLPLPLLPQASSTRAPPLPLLLPRHRSGGEAPFGSGSSGMVSAGRPRSVSGAAATRGPDPGPVRVGYGLFLLFSFFLFY
jgi:hypothetical protein